MGRKNRSLLSVVAVTAAFCVPGLGHARSTDELHQLAAEVRALRALTDLQLSSEQVRKLHELAQQAAGFRQDYEKQLDGVESEAIAELQARKEQILSGNLMKLLRITS